MDKQSTKVLDLFCGAGGFSVGIDDDTIEVIAGIDINESALETYRANIDAPGYNIDIAETTPEELLQQIGADTEDIDIVTGGPPCQGFSLAGDRDPDDPRNKLVDSYFDLIAHIEPSLFYMENVKGLLSMDDGEVIRGLEQRIEDIGYEYDYSVLNAADYGVPQTRERLILIGSKHVLPTLPDPTHDDDWVPLRTVLDGTGETADGKSYLVTSPSGDSYQVHGRDSFRTTDAPAYTHTGRYSRLIPPEFVPHDDATPATAQHRRLTKRESARIQSFPDDYEWRGNGIMRQQGNAMPPRLANAISSSIAILKYNNLKADLRESRSYPNVETHRQTKLTDHGFVLAGD
ncbi:DNA cytosine methyltransferase [Haloarcula sp. CGMCC 1.6347]|uniref:DNA cytosine methyltransferase n=1 Tax=Haloarcula sp. CGMCC 1.6347 TaxID=3111455 RepID=UPI00300EA7FE